MNWFKHMTNMRNDTKIRRLINKYGLLGYGLYNIILETIVEKLTTQSPSPDLQETSKDIAEFYNEDTAKIEEIVTYMIEQKLFSLCDKNMKISCPKIYKFLEANQTKSEEIRNLIKVYKNIKNGDNNYLQTAKKVSDFSEEKNIKEMNIKEMNIKDKLIAILNFWNDKKIIIHKEEIFLHNVLTSKNNLKSGIKSVIEIRDIEEIKKAIDNYSKVLKEDNYYWEHKYSLWDFLTRGIEKFVNEADPLNNFKRNSKNSFKKPQKSEPTYDYNYNDDDFKKFNEEILKTKTNLEDLF